MKYCFTDCVPVFMRWCRHLFIQDLFLFLFQKRFLLAKKNYSEDGIPLAVVATVLMFHPLKIYQIKAEVLHWCRTPPSLLSQSNWAQWAGNLSIIPHCWISTYLSFIYSEVLFIMPPPSPIVTWMVYCFPCRQLIFSFDRSGIYHLKGLLQYIPKWIPSVCPSICTTFF